LLPSINITVSMTNDTDALALADATRPVVERETIKICLQK
jgi:hypothetical protein